MASKRAGGKEDPARDQKRTKVATPTSELEDLNQALASFDPASIVTLLDQHFEDRLVVGEVGKRLIQLLQRTKDLAWALKEPAKRIRPALALKDTAAPHRALDIPLWHNQVAEINAILTSSLSELCGDAEEQEAAHLSVVVDAFAEELDQIRQKEDLGPNKLELLIDALKTAGSP